MSAVLTTRLKITDLTAETALETGRRLLPEGISLERLVREELYLFEAAPGHAATAFEAPLEQAIESSNFFVNPNKERYRFLRSAGRGDSLVPPPAPRSQADATGRNRKNTTTTKSAACIVRRTPTRCGC